MDRYRTEMLVGARIAELHRDAATERLVRMTRTGERAPDARRKPVLLARPIRWLAARIAPAT
jgi:hypothetical protein